MPRAVVVTTAAVTARAPTRGAHSGKGRSGKAVASSSIGGCNPALSRRPVSRLKATAHSSSRAGASDASTSAANRKRKVADVAGDSPVPPSRARKSPRRTVKKMEEKRLAPYVSQPSVATDERIARAFQHRLYLIDKKVVGDPCSPSGCDFNVLGATGNVYGVKLQQKPFCTCPDFPRSKLCKHILFVMLRVLKLDRSDPRVWQKALLTSELNDLLEISAIDDSTLASLRVRRQFQELEKSSGVSEGTDVDKKSIQREISGDCPICYEKMDDGQGKSKEPVVFCRVCGNNVHRDCFGKWSRSKSSSGVQATCIYCRSLWSDESKKKGKVSSKYINLSSFSEPHRTQDSSVEALYPNSYEWFGFRSRRRS